VISYGIESTVDYTYSIGDFTTNVGGYFNFYKSKILEMNEIPRPFPYLERTNRPVDQYFGLQQNGFFQDQADIANSPKQSFQIIQRGT